ncbi:hypothetical protein DT23_03985 [Thioclava indica]|uniref:Uncharacterized protein n=1 Tax=Thioclava indica TaxID=1353528 RepID=A0A074JRZ8_9RHOB|nr:hypothetical protein DT23_03985 [Thioclava indica]
MMTSAALIGGAIGVKVQAARLKEARVSGQ